MATIFGYEEQQGVHRIGVGDYFEVMNARKTSVSDTDMSDRFYYNGCRVDTNSPGGLTCVLCFQRSTHLGLVDMFFKVNRFSSVAPRNQEGYRFPSVRGRILVREIGSDFTDIVLKRADETTTA